MTTEGYSRWRHVFKLDPERTIADEELDRVCMSGTDAIVVGGSSGVTFDNTVDLLSRIRRYEVPCVLEVSALEAAVPGFDQYFIPVVLNSSNADWIVGKHLEAVKEYGGMLPWDLVAGEGYLVLNPDSTVAHVTEARAELETKDVLAYARLSERLYRLPIFYMEYSGRFGDMKLVRQVKGCLQSSRLFYGGGVDSPERAREAAMAADTVIVGNVIYESLDNALATVQAVKAVEKG